MQAAGREEGRNESMYGRKGESEGGGGEKGERGRGRGRPGVSRVNLYGLVRRLFVGAVVPPRSGASEYG